MKRIIPFLCLLLAVNASAQLRQPLLPHLNDIPALPTSYAEASSKCYSPTGCNTDTIAANFTAKHLALTKQLNSTIMSNTTAPTVDTSMVSTLKNMTPDQQRAWAMQYAMQQQAAAASQPVKLPSADETEFRKEYNATLLTQNQFMDSIVMTWQRMDNDFATHMTDFEKKREDLLNKCPQEASGGEIGASAPCARSVETQYQGWVNDYYKQWMAQTQAFITKKKAETQARYGSLENLLAKMDYMSNPSSPNLKTDATSLQQTILSIENSLTSITQDAWGRGCLTQDNITQSQRRSPK